MDLFANQLNILDEICEVLSVESLGSNIDRSEIDSSSDDDEEEDRDVVDSGIYDPEDLGNLESQSRTKAPRKMKCKFTNIN